MENWWEEVTFSKKCIRTSPSRPYSVPKDSYDQYYPSLILTKYQQFHSFNEVRIVPFLLLFTCNTLSKPLVSTCIKIVLQGWQYFYDNNYKALPYTIATLLQIPQQIVRDNQSQSNYNTEMSSEVKVVFNLCRNHPMLVLLPLVQQLDLVLFQHPVVKGKFQFFLARFLMVQQLTNEEALMKCANSNSCVYYKQRVANGNDSKENNGNKEVESKSEQTNYKILGTFLSSEDKSQKDKVKHQRPYHLSQHSHLRNTNTKENT